MGKVPKGPQTQTRIKMFRLRREGRNTALPHSRANLHLQIVVELFTHCNILFDPNCRK